MRYEVWVLDNCHKQIIMRIYKNYKEAKNVAKSFASQEDILRVWIYGSEYIKDITEDD